MKIVLCLLLFACPLLTEQVSKAVVLTYPRSGTHLFMHYANFLLRDPKTKHFESSKIHQLHHHHGFKSMEKVCKKPWQQLIDPEKDYLILVLRNYRESMLRHFGGDCMKVLSHLEDDRTAPYQLRFFENLQHFDEWPEERRLLIYYEDLLQYPERELTRFVEFIGASQKRYNNLINNLDQHKQETIDYYNKEHIKRSKPSVGSQSEGKDFLFHSKKVPHEYLLQMDYLAKQRNLDLYETYLLRFKTHSD